MYDNGYGVTHGWQGEGEWLGELLAVPLDPRFSEPVTAVQFDQQYEALWAGTESGMLYTVQCPTLTRYASWQAHSSAVLDIALLSDCAVSVSSSRVALSANGGYTRAAANLLEDGKAWVSAVVEPSTGSSRLLIAGSSGHVYTHDLITNKVAKQPVAVAGEGLSMLRGPVGHRGAVAAATTAGRVLLIDSRTNWQPSSTTLAHTGGVSAMEVQGDLVATAGFSKRMGQVMADNMVKVFDCRSAIHPLFTLPCAAPGMLAWHPVNSMSLLCTSPTGLFMLADPSNPAAAETYQVETAGDSLRCAGISPSGEAVVFGGSGGYLHLWSASHQPRISARSRQQQRLVHPVRKASRPRPVIAEAGPFDAVPGPPALLLAAAAAAGATSAAAAAAAVAGTRLLSDVPETLCIDVGKPARVVDAALKKELKQVDFVGYIPNPHYSRAKAAGTARKAALHLQHTRLKLAEEKANVEAARAARVQNRLAAGGTLLPQRYKRLVIRAQSSMRFEEFDFTYYNKTRFAGLENDLPNCYCNALLQVLYFTPAFRAAILQHKPEPSAEFCLSCELLFLFKMLLSAAGGLPCQALNLLRALRQNREAAALGLLEGTIGAGAGGLGLGSLSPGPGGGTGPSATGLGGVGVGALVMGGAGQGLGSNAGGGGGSGADGGAGGSGLSGWGSRAAQLAAASALPKRVVTLCRFLMDHLYKEAGGESAATAHSSAAASSTEQPDSSSAAEAIAAAALSDTQQQQQAGKSAAANGKGGKGIKGKEVADSATAGSTGGSKETAAAAAAGGSSGSAGDAAQAKLANIIQELFGLVYRADMTALSGPKKGTSKSRQLKTFQVDLAYPQPTSSSSSKAWASAGSAAAGGIVSPLTSPLKGGVTASLAPGAAVSPGPTSPFPPLSPSTPVAAAAAAAMPGLSLGPGAVDRPGFKVLLANSLRSEGATKAWFDEAGGYAYVRHSRVPLVLPKVHEDAWMRPETLVINCAMSHPSQVAFWEPKPAAAAAAAAVTPRGPQQQLDASTPAGSSTSASNTPAAAKGNSSSSSPFSGTAGSQQQQQQQHAEVSWLPWVLQVRSDPAASLVDVVTADTHAELADNICHLPDVPIKASYELTAIICHIIDEDEADTPANAAAAANAAPGSAGLKSPSPAAGRAGSSSNSSSSSSTSRLPHQGHAVALIRVQPPYLDPDLPGGLQRFPSAAMQPLKSVGSGAAAAAAGSNLTRRISISTRGSSSSGLAAVAGSGSGSGVKKGAKRSGSGGGGGSAAAGFGLPDSLDDVFAELSFTSRDEEEQQQQDGNGQAVDGSSSSDASDSQTAAAATADSTAPSASSASQQQASTAAVVAAGPAEGSSSSGSAVGGMGQQWVVINDFSISPISAYEVMNWYDGQKLPCLLFYSQVSELEAAKEMPPPKPPSPVDAQTFAALCAAPPLQGPSWRGLRSFTPLEFPREAPRPGFMVAIDAEFVAVARAETSFEGGVEVQLKPSRLALARVSVLRGSGPAAGTAFIDDYVACVEPVVDYLTRWSGIRPGDLDPSSSQHHLVSLKAAYLKLHHLLDAGCVFTGHGLKQDFRMLNLTVPPEQVRDTVELFSFRRQRKLSLRFLASYLLGLTIQTGAGAAGGAAAAAAAAAAATSQAAAAAAGKAGRGTPGSTSGKLAGCLAVAGAAAAAGGGGGQQSAASASAAGGGVLPVMLGGQGHDSIEDAATALALYNVYCKLQAEGKLEAKLHEMYRWGKQYGWEPVVHVKGVPQPPPGPGVVGLAPPVL